MSLKRLSLAQLAQPHKDKAGFGKQASLLLSAAHRRIAQPYFWRFLGYFISKKKEKKNEHSKCC